MATARQGPDSMNSGCCHEYSKVSQIFVGGAVSGCKTAVLSKDYKTYPMLLDIQL